MPYYIPWTQNTNARGARKRCLSIRFATIGAKRLCALSAWAFLRRKRSEKSRCPLKISSKSISSAWSADSSSQLQEAHAQSCSAPTARERSSCRSRNTRMRTILFLSRWMNGLIIEPKPYFFSRISWALILSRKSPARIRNLSPTYFLAECNSWTSLL